MFSIVELNSGKMIKKRKKEKKSRLFRTKHKLVWCIRYGVIH